MRLRLFHTLSLTLLAFTGLAVLALGGLTAWNLRHGFADYLAARDVAHLERVVGVLEAELAHEQGLQALQQGRLALRPLLDRLRPSGLLEAGRPAPPSPPPWQDDDAPPTLPPGPPENGPDAFPQRFCVVGLDGRLLMGTALPAAAERVAERPVHAQGRVVAWARMRPAPLVRGGGEARFLHDQYLVIGVGSVGLMLLALLTAALLARRWTRPLEAVQQATRRLARGEFGLRLQPGVDFARRSDEIGDLVDDVNQLADGLQGLESARRRWLADISHELRTPLTVLRGDIDALHEGVRPLRPEAIAVLRDEVLRLNRLVDDLHLLAMSDLQALPCHWSGTDAVALLQRVVQRFQGRAEAAGLQLGLDLPADTSSLEVQWDALRIEQLLANLLENSLRYTDAPGQVQLQLQWRQLPPSVRGRKGAEVEITVDDSAPGVAAEHLPHLLEPLYRTDAARARRHGGSGLGLAICAAMAQAHGGTLGTAPSPLGGLRVQLRLPAQPGADR